MKKIFQILTSVVVSAAFFGGFASAATCSGDFSITGTGPNSNNSISCSDISNVTSTCTNSGLILNYNDQHGSSGTATVTNNTTGGSATSGTITNTNGSTVNLATACNVPSVPVANTTPTTPGGKGAITLPTVLPYTASSSLMTNIIAGLMVASGIAVVSRLATAAVRRLIIR